MGGSSAAREGTSQLESALTPSLLDLDPHRHARTELRSAGVAERQIEALYPKTFAAVLPGLLHMLAALPGPELECISLIEPQADSILYAREHRQLGPGVGESTVLHRSSLNAFQQAVEGGDDDAFLKLRGYLFRRISDLSLPRGSSLPTFEATKVLWCTHWFQVHRHELAPKYTGEAQALDTRVCQILGVK